MQLISRRVSKCALLKIFYHMTYLTCIFSVFTEQSGCDESTTEADDQSSTSGSVDR